MDTGFPKKIPPPIDQSCVGYWKFDEWSNDTIKDFSGSNNTGTVYGTPSELLTNSRFDTNISSWTILSGTVVWDVEGAIDVTRTSANNCVKQEVTLTAGTYILSSIGKYIANLGNGQVFVYDQTLTTSYGAVYFSSTDSSYVAKSATIVIPSNGTYAIVIVNANTATARFRFSKISLIPQILGKFNNAMKFDGINDYIDLGDYDNIPEFQFGTGNWSVFAWIKPNTHSIESTVCGMRTGADHDFRIGIYSNNKAYVTWVDYPSHPAYSYTIGSSLINDGNWHHIGAKRDGATITLYVDGNVEGIDTTVSNHNITGPEWYSRWSIGAYFNGCCGTFEQGYWTTFYNGTIDEVRIYNRVLTSQEIKRHYMAGR